VLILVLNPGSTSTRVALYLDGRCLDSKKLSVGADVLDLPLFPEQYEARKRSVFDYLGDQGLEPSRLDAVAARGGRLKPLRSGVYRVCPEMVAHAKAGLQGQHPSNLAVVLAAEIEADYGVPGYTVDPISVDEMSDIAKITGLKDISRSSLSHALSMKSVARKASRALGIKYEKAKLIVAHLGGGGSVSAHLGGRMVDLYNSDQEGPFAVERAGGMPSLKLLAYMREKGLSPEAATRKLAHEGGLYSHFGTRDFEQMVARAERDPGAKLVLDAYVYQVAKAVSSFLPIFDGAVDAVVFTGGVVNAPVIRSELERYLSFIDRLLWYPGEFEMDALEEGVREALLGLVPVLDY